MSIIKTPVLIIGAGLAGQSMALHLADQVKVLLVTKRTLADSASQWAQGGIAAAVDDEDSWQNHEQDTLETGAGLCKPEVVRKVVAYAPQGIAWLREQGVHFTQDADSSSGLHLHQEGGHHHRRVVHAADATGSEVQDVLIQKIRHHPNISILEYHIAVDLICGWKINRPEEGCLGAYVFDIRQRKVITIAAARTVLASGGVGKVYLYTTNPEVATADGVAMAWRAGVPVANMEFIQFHPTCLYSPVGASTSLLTEALRGEGGLLKLPDGTRFMPRYHPQAELAPRDVVARAIDSEMKKKGLDYVLLDITHKPREFLVTHFPNIYARCLKAGLDLTKLPLPVVPAAHYGCGGVVIDGVGRTRLPHLYAIGETAHSGLHGANRLASNSLLECLAYSRFAASDILDQLSHGGALKIPANLSRWDESRVSDADEEVVISHNWDELRRFMWDYVGIVRTHKRLERALHRVHLLAREIHEYYSNFRVSNDLIELRNLVVAANLIVRSSLKRHESRGLHFNPEFPNLLPKAKDTVLIPAKKDIAPGL